MPLLARGRTACSNYYRLLIISLCPAPLQTIVVTTVTAAARAHYTSTPLLWVSNVLTRLMFVLPIALAVIIFFLSSHVSALSRRGGKPSSLVPGDDVAVRQLGTAAVPAAVAAALAAQNVGSAVVFAEVAMCALVQLVVVQFVCRKSVYGKQTKENDAAKPSTSETSKAISTGSSTLSLLSGEVSKTNDSREDGAKPSTAETVGPAVLSYAAQLQTSFARGTFAVAALVSLPVMLHMFIVSHVIVVHLMEKAPVGGALPIPGWHLVADSVVGFSSAFATLLVLWPMFPWLPVAFPTTLPTPPTTAQNPPLFTRKATAAFLTLFALGLALIGPFVTQPFTSEK